MTQALLALGAGAIIAICALIFWAYREGRRTMSREREAQARDRYHRTTERMRNAPIVTDADTARRWLRARDPDQR